VKIGNCSVASVIHSAANSTDLQAVLLGRYRWCARHESRATVKYPGSVLNSGSMDTKLFFSVEIDFEQHPVVESFA
jgi:hypothetical protein